MQRLHYQIALAVLIFCSQPAWSDVRIQDIVINHRESERDDDSELPCVTIELENRGDRASYPGLVRLEIRADSNQPWRQLRSWDLSQNNLLLASGETFEVDYWPTEEEAEIHDLFEGNYEIRAWIRDSDHPRSDKSSAR